MPVGTRRRDAGTSPRQSVTCVTGCQKIHMCSNITIICTRLGASPPPTPFLHPVVASPCDPDTRAGSEPERADAGRTGSEASLEDVLPFVSGNDGPSSAKHTPPSEPPDRHRHRALESALGGSTAPSLLPASQHKNSGRTCVSAGSRFKWVRPAVSRDSSGYVRQYQSSPGEGTESVVDPSAPTLP